MTNIKKKSIIKPFQIVSLFAVLVALLGLCRCFRFETNSIVLILFFLLLGCLLLKGENHITFFDILVFFLPVFVLVHKYNEYPWGPCIYYMVAWAAFFLLRKEDNIKKVLQASAIFSIINMVVNLINIVSPQTYHQIVSLLLNKESIESIDFYYSRYGYISGLSDHFSRNAYFCVLGATVFLSIFFANPKKGKKYLFIGLAQIAMIMVIGKRGHLLFVGAAVLIVFLLLEPNISKRIVNILRGGIVISAVFGILIETVPSILFVFERFSIQQNMGDVSNGRFFLWNTAISYFQEKPIFGWGYGYFNSTVRNDYLNITYAGVHNDYLQWLCEMGIVGFLINIIITFGLYSLSIRELKRIVSKKGRLGTDRQVFIIWSVIFQTFVILYSTTGLPHFDYEINILYYVAICIPLVLLKSQECKDIRLWRKTIRWIKK